MHHHQTTAQGQLVPHVHPNGHHKGHRNRRHRHNKSHYKPNATFGFYKAIFFLVVLIGLGWLAQHAHELRRYAPETPASLYDGPHWSVNQYGPFKVWREQVEDVSLAVTKWLQEATTLHEHRRRGTAILLKLEEGNEALIVMRSNLRSDNYPIWAEKLKDLRSLVKQKPMPGSPAAIELETLVHKLVNGLLWLMREALYT